MPPTKHIEVTTTATAPPTAVDLACGLHHDSDEFSGVINLQTDAKACSAVADSLNAVLTACVKGAYSQKNAVACSAEKEGTGKSMLVVAKKKKSADTQIRKKLNAAMLKYTTLMGLKKTVVNEAAAATGFTFAVRGDGRGIKCSAVARVLAAMAQDKYACLEPTTIAPATTAPLASTAPTPGNVQCIAHSAQHAAHATCSVQCTIYGQHTVHSTAYFLSKNLWYKVYFWYKV